MGIHVHTHLSDGCHLRTVRVDGLKFEYQLTEDDVRKVPTYANMCQDDVPTITKVFALRILSCSLRFSPAMVKSWL